MLWIVFIRHSVFWGIFFVQNFFLPPYRKVYIVPLDVVTWALVTKGRQSSADFEYVDIQFIANYINLYKIT